MPSFRRKFGFLKIFLLAALFSLLFVIGAFPLFGSQTERERFLGLVRNVADGLSQKIAAPDLGDQVCLIEEGVFAPDIVVARFFTDAKLDESEFIDQSSGYWTLVLVDASAGIAKLISISQSEVTWRWVDPAERDDLRSEQEVLCYSELIILNAGGRFRLLN